MDHIQYLDEQVTWRTELSNAKYYAGTDARKRMKVYPSWRRALLVDTYNKTQGKENFAVHNIRAYRDNAYEAELHPRLGILLKFKISYLFEYHGEQENVVCPMPLPTKH